jgi:hypothetical protein
LNLAGLGTSTIAAEIRATSLAFPDQVTGNTSPAQSIVYVNTGNSPVTITSVTSSNNAEFPISNGCPLSPAALAPGPFATCTITVNFMPSATGTRSGNVTIVDNAPGSRVVAVSGKGVAPVQAVEVTPLGIVFPNQVVGTPSNTQTITLNFVGNSPVNVASIVPAGADFSVSPGCTGSQPPGQCQLTVTFTPLAAGTRSGSVKITDSAPGSPRTVTFTGTGVTPAKTLVVTPTTVNFIPQVVNTSSGFTQTVNVTNTGTFNVTFTNVTISGNFSESNGCIGVLTPGSFCSIQLSFTPASATKLVGTVTITDDATGSPQKVTLNGTGITTSQEISLSQTNVVFDEQVVGVASQPMVVYYYNQGNVTVNITNVTLTGADFSQNHGCDGASVSPNTGCAIRVTFTPTATGVRNGSITITDTAPGSPRTITLSGTGAAAPPPGPGANQLRRPRISAINRKELPALRRSSPSPTPEAPR